MPHVNQYQPDEATIRAAIQLFLEKRLQPKLDKLTTEDEDQRQQLLQAHQPHVWIADAARRVSQIQQVTHALKYIHPDAKGTNLTSKGNQAANELLVATHTLAEQYRPDVVGNAAALDVYKFLRLEVGGKTLLDLAVQQDAALKAALSENGEQAASWMASFASVTESKGTPASNTLAKQIYWPIDNHGYHLLAPLFPSSLVHQVWSTIREDRFSEEAKAARDARKKDIPHAYGYREYRNLVVQKFGGTKPQNISQLNSERYGENYLLSSCPPIWHSDPVKPPLKVESIFDGWFERRSEVRRQLGMVRRFLVKAQPINNIRIRKQRALLVAGIVDELLLCASELQDLDGVWTLRQDCRLNMDEQCWLNPVRAATDEEFASTCARGDWKESVCKRFGSWLNARILDPKNPLPFGEVEAHEWRSVLEKEIGLLHTEIAAHE